MRISLEVYCPHFLKAYCVTHYINSRWPKNIKYFLVVIHLFISNKNEKAQEENLQKIDNDKQTMRRMPLHLMSA